MTQIEIGTFDEILLPFEQREETLTFYQQLGYAILNETDWGLIQLQRQTEKLSLLPSAWFKQTARCYLLPNKAALFRLREQLAQAEIRFEDDIENEPARLSFYDPSGNECLVMAANE